MRADFAKFVETEVLNVTVTSSFECLFYLRRDQEKDLSQFPNLATYFDAKMSRCVFGWVPMQELQGLGIESREKNETRVMVDFRCTVPGKTFAS